MKTIAQISLILSLCIGTLGAQTVIFSESFDTGSPNWGTLNTTIGAQGTHPNIFYISNTEAGLPAGSCGAGGGTDLSLHVSSTTVGDLGAAYDASSACLPGCFICDLLGPGFPFCQDVTTDVRSESVSFSTVGHVGMTIAFDYMEYGETTNDNARMYYNIGGGWVFLNDLPKTLCCGGAACTGLIQGLWTSFSLALPVAMEGQANVRIGFRWNNNADALGSDPSFAIDDISITKPTILPVNWLSFEVNDEGFDSKVSWATTSEINSDKFTVQRSTDAINFKDIRNVNGAGNSSQTSYYSVIDSELTPGIYYYRIKQIDLDGRYELSETIQVQIRPGNITELYAYPNPSNGSFSLQINTMGDEAVDLKMFDQSGRLVISTQSLIQKGSSTLEFDMRHLSAGQYTIQAASKDQVLHTKMLLND